MDRKSNHECQMANLFIERQDFNKKFSTNARGMFYKLQEKTHLETLQ
jgi:hypothetical protein